MIAAIHAARRRKREAAEKAATRTSAVGPDVDCSDAESVTLEESTHSTASSPQSGTRTFLPADSNTKLRWEEISLPPPRSICFCLPRQLDVFRFYISQPVQIATAVLIISNFLFNCAEKVSCLYGPRIGSFTVATLANDCFRARRSGTRMPSSCGRRSGSGASSPSTRSSSSSY